MNKKREENRKKREKRVIYDSMAIGERTLNAFIIFGLVALSVAVICGYFMGNYGTIGEMEGGSVPVSYETVCFI